MIVEAEFFTRLMNNPDLAFSTPIKPDDFTIDAYRLGFLELRRQLQAGITPDISTICLAYPQHSMKLTAINTAVRSNFDLFERKMIIEVENRRTRRACLDVLRNLDSSDGSASLLNEAVDLLVECRVSGSGKKKMSFFDCAVEFGPILEERYKNKGQVLGVTTGFEKLDKLLGGFQQSIYFIGARPSHGKTAMLLSMIRAALKSGRRAALITLESSHLSIIQRVLSAEGPISMNKIRTGGLKPQDFNSLTDTFDRMRGWKGFIDFDPKAVLSDIERTCVQFVKSDGVEIIFIDYLQRIAAPGRTKVEEVANASRALTDLSRTLNIPIVCLAQTGRQADHEIPQISHFQHSSQIEQDADVAMIISHKDDGDKRSSWLNVLKNRDGDTGDVPIFFDPDTVKFLTEGER